VLGTLGGEGAFWFTPEPYRNLVAYLWPSATDRLLLSLAGKEPLPCTGILSFSANVMCLKEVRSALYEYAEEHEAYMIWRRPHDDCARLFFAESWSSTIPPCDESRCS